MPITMSRRKQSNPKPLKSDSDVDEPMDDSSSTSPAPDQDDEDQTKSTILPPSVEMEVSSEADDPEKAAKAGVEWPVERGTTLGPFSAEMDVSSEADDPEKAARVGRVEWPVRRGTTLGPFSARIEVVQEECDRENSICVRGSSKALFSIFILEFYCEDVLNRTNIKPASVNGPRAALIYIYKPDKQLYLLTLKDVDEHESIPTLFLEGGQDAHPRSDEVNDLIQREVDAAGAVHKASGGSVVVAARSHLQMSTDGASPLAEGPIPNNEPIPSIQEPIEVPSVSCQSCGVTFRNPANLSAHQLYYCAARETTPVPPSTRSRPARQPSTHREAYAADHASVAKESGQPEDLVCILCKASFSNLTNCLSHMIKLHTEQNSQACKCCNFISVDIKLLKEHMLIHVRGSGINPNIFMASQGGHGLMGPLAFHGMKDRRLEEKRRRKKHHQAPGSQSLSPPHEGGSSSTSTMDQDHHDDIKTGSAVRCREQNGNLSPGSRSAETDPSPLSSDTRRTPPAPSNDIEKAQNDIQTRPIGRFLCVECDIYFSSHKNYVAHKQFYCQGHSKERKQTGHVQVPPAPSPSVPLVQCGSCSAVFPSRDKLAVHTLYFCQCRKPGKSSSLGSDPVAEKSNQQDRSSPKKDSGSGKSAENEDKTNSDNSTTKSAPSVKPQIKVEESDEDAFASDREHKLTVVGNGGASPNAPVYPHGISSSGISPGSVLLAPGNMPTYIGRQGNSPVYIVASHVYVTPPGEPGSRGITPALYPQFSTVVPAGREVVFKGDHGATIPGERPLDLTVRKRKGCEEIVSQGGSASKVIKNESLDQKSSPSSPTSHSESKSRNAPPFSLQNFPEHVQYHCPGCQIAFNRLESLDIHRQFYCQSDGANVDRIPVPHPSTSLPVHTALPALPYYKIVTNPSSANGSTLVPALATVNIRDNQPAIPESKINERNRSCSKGRNSPGTEAMEGISTSGSTSPPQLHEATSKDKGNKEKVEGGKVIQQTSGRNPESVSIPLTSRMSPTQPGSPHSVVKLPSGQNGESGEPSGNTVPMYMPSVVRYMCPSCGVSFMKLESLSAHQQFYCRASQEVLSTERSSPKGKKSKDIVLPDSIPRTVTACPKSRSRSPESEPVPTSRRSTPSKKNEATLGARKHIDVSDSLQGHSNGTNGTEVLPAAEKCDDSGNESRTSLSPGENGQDNSTNLSCKEKEKDNPCIIKIKLEKLDDDSGCNPPVTDLCAITDNNNVINVKTERIDEDSCCSRTANSIPNTCRQENGRTEALSLNNGCHSPESRKGVSECGTPGAVDSTESQAPASPPDAVNGSRHNGTAAVPGTAGRPATVMLKHCRACNISFSSLSTFIAHKKYYCASHHVTKNTVH